MKYSILIIDDDELICASMKKVLTKLGYEVETCSNGCQVEETVKRFQPDVILLDIYLSDFNGIDILKEMQKKYYYIPVIMITGYSDVKTAVEAMKIGAFDFLLKPLEVEQLEVVIKKAIDKITLQKEINRLRELASGNEINSDSFGLSKVILKVVNMAERLAASPDTTILLEGESGVGKEYFAKFIHQRSPRKSAPFVSINCGAIPKELAESELFGHEKGAFTGAAPKTKLGKFELANGGTILLDEIGELSLDLQVKLLRVLQEKKFFRLGGEKEISVDVRVIAATNRNLEEEVKKGNFREDLYYRLNVAKIIIPPLRERKDDIKFFAMKFIDEFSRKFNIQIKTVDKDVFDLLENQLFRGNIRELRNAIERAVLMLDENELKRVHFSFLEKDENTPRADEFVLKIPKNGIRADIVLKELILKTLQITNGNQVKAAKILGLSRSKLRYRMEQLGIEVSKKIE